MRKFAVVERKKGVSAYELVGSKLMLPTYSFWKDEECPEQFKFYANYADLEQAREALEKVGKVYVFREEKDGERIIWKGL